MSLHYLGKHVRRSNSMLHQCRFFLDTVYTLTTKKRSVNVSYSPLADELNPASQWRQYVDKFFPQLIRNGNVQTRLYPRHYQRLHSQPRRQLINCTYWWLTRVEVLLLNRNKPSHFGDDSIKETKPNIKKHEIQKETKLVWTTEKPRSTYTNKQKNPKLHHNNNNT